MKGTFLMTITLLTLLFGQTSTSIANLTNVSQAINGFVEKIYPKGSHYFWVINDTTTESQHEMVVDINTTLQGEANKEKDQHRFLILIVNGEFFGAQKIPLNAEVKCKKEQEV
ncbi:hypothetical protein [Candidatus Nitrospira salsa]|nr:MAG: hypothetical protein NPIRA01_40410 [Nitrospirales bacterium]